MAPRSLALILAAALCGCAAPGAPRTEVMGAGPACDLSITVGADHSCPVQHVAPDSGEPLISNGTHLHR